jgi:hypothetical protein
MPRMLGQMMVFGRQTDREPRVEVVAVTPADREVIESQLRQIAGDALAESPEFQTMTHVSASQETLQAQWWPPQNADPEQVTRLVEQFLDDALLKRWPELKLGALDGRSPREAASDEAMQRRLGAVLLVLEATTERITSDFDFNRLRDELNLPPAEPIDPEQLPLAQLPVIRYDRVIIDKLDDESLIHGFRKASVYRAPAVKRFAAGLVARESLAGTDEQIRAYTALGQAETDPAKAAEIYDQGRRAAEAAGRSHVSFDLAELALKFARGDAEDIGRLIDHIQTDHMDEPGVREALTQMLMQFGVLNPDGSPGPAITGGRPEMGGAPAGVGAGGPEAAAGMPGGPAPAAQPAPPEEQPGKLWTPDSQSGGGGGKLWTPD